MSTENRELVSRLSITAQSLVEEFNSIPVSRQDRLIELASAVRDKVQRGRRAHLTFICTHNSRRSIMAELWSHAAAHYYGIYDVDCYSGGTESTQFNPLAIDAMRDIGFEIRNVSEGTNPVYEVTFSSKAKPVTVFSKKYDDPFNPRTDFVAVMTCSHAEANCPLVSGASKRISITYDDPKDFDGTPLESDKYRERALQIGREMLFAFSKSIRL